MWPITPPVISHIWHQGSTRLQLVLTYTDLAAMRKDIGIVTIVTSRWEVEGISTLMQIPARNKGTVSFPCVTLPGKCEYCWGTCLDVTSIPFSSANLLWVSQLDTFHHFSSYFDGTPWEMIKIYYFLHWHHQTLFSVNQLSHFLMENFHKMAWTI